MQNRIFKAVNIKKAAFISSILILSLSLYTLYKVMTITDESFINCSSVFASYAENSRLQGNVQIYLNQGKGSIMIIGDFVNAAGVRSPVRLLTGFEYTSERGGLNIKVTKASSSTTDVASNQQLQLMVPFFLTRPNIDYIYEFVHQSNRDYLIKQNGNNLMYCSNIS